MKLVVPKSPVYSLGHPFESILVLASDDNITCTRPSLYSYHLYSLFSFFFSLPETRKYVNGVVCQSVSLSVRPQKYESCQSVSDFSSKVLSRNCESQIKKSILTVLVN